MTLVQDDTRTYIPIARSTAAEISRNDRLLAILTPQQRRILELMVAGEANKRIANALNLSVRTIERHRHKLMMRLHVTTPAEAARIYSLSSEQLLKT